MALNFGDVSSDTALWYSGIPDLGLVRDSSLPFRVYVLRCAPQKEGSPYTWYVGLVHKSKLAERLERHRLGACHFTRVHRPLAVVLLWPVASRAAEAYVYYALVEKFPGVALQCGRLGGWTQTASKLNPLGAMMLQREKWMLEGLCLECGKGCTWGACKTDQAEASGARYNCDHCGAFVRITNQGKSATEPPQVCVCPPCRGQATKRARDTSDGGDGRAASATSARVRTSSASGIQNPSSASVRARTPAAVQRAPCFAVHICGEKYSTLKWFLGRREYPNEAKKVLADTASCVHAVQIQGGDAKTLVSSGFARLPPQRPKELFPRDVPPGHLQRLPTKFEPTACPTVKRGEKNASGKVMCRKRPEKMDGYRGVLWRISDMVRVLAESKTA